MCLIYLLIFLRNVAALFFCTYENTKRLLNSNGFFTIWQPIVHMTSAAFGEVVSHVHLFLHNKNSL
jgi:hypothetical protein